MEISLNNQNVTSQYDYIRVMNNTVANINLFTPSMEHIGKRFKFVKAYAAPYVSTTITASAGFTIQGKTASSPVYTWGASQSFVELICLLTPESTIVWSVFSITSGWNGSTIVETNRNTINTIYGVTNGVSSRVRGVSTSGDGKYILATAYNNGKLGVFVSSDYGNNFNEQYVSTIPMDGSGDVSAWTRCNALSSSGRYMVTGTQQRGTITGNEYNRALIFMSTDYGSSWRSVAPENTGAYVSICVSDDGNTILALHDGSGVLITINGGTSWNNISSLNAGAGSDGGNVTASANGKYRCRHTSTTNKNKIYTSTDSSGVTWTDYTFDVSNILIDGSSVIINSINSIKLSPSGQTLCVIATDTKNRRCVYTSKNFIKSRLDGTLPIWKKTNFPGLIKYNYTSPAEISSYKTTNSIPDASSNVNLMVKTRYNDISYNNSTYTNVSSDGSWNSMNYYTNNSNNTNTNIAISDNGQNIIVLCPATSVVSGGTNFRHEDANIFISNDFGERYRSIIPDASLAFPYCSYNFNSIETTRSGKYIYFTSDITPKNNPYSSNSQTTNIPGLIYNYVPQIYTYSYTPIRISYNNTMNFVFTSTLYDCSGTYYLRDDKLRTLATRVIDVSYTTSITFTDISTNSFEYGMTNLTVYKQNDIIPNNAPIDDIQISDPMVVNATCFLEGTKILAMDKKRILKYIPIEKLKPGMLVKTLSSGFVPIKYIGYSTLYNPGLATRVRDQLFKCTKSAYPELIEDLVLTGNHSILVEKVTDEEREQIIETLGDLFITEQRYRLPAFNDKRAVPYEHRGDFRIWNLALEHENYYANYGIYANGLLVETTSCRYLKEISRMTLVEK